MSLWKEIEGSEGVDRVPSGEEFFEIARECCRVAGDVGDLRRVEI